MLRSCTKCDDWLKTTQTYDKRLDLLKFCCASCDVVWYVVPASEFRWPWQRRKHEDPHKLRPGLLAEARVHE